MRLNELLAFRADDYTLNARRTHFLKVYLFSLYILLYILKTRLTVCLILYILILYIRARAKRAPEVFSEPEIKVLNHVPIKVHILKN